MGCRGKKAGPRCGPAKMIKMGDRYRTLCKNVTENGCVSLPVKVMPPLVLPPRTAPLGRPVAGFPATMLSAGRAQPLFPPLKVDFDFRFLRLLRSSALKRFLS